MSGVTALAPAKLNLGLEILGRRSDGYHEIATVMQTVSIFDRLSVEAIEAAGDRPFRWTGLPLRPDEDLALQAALLARSRWGVEQGASWRLAKRIPVAAGLGGASSDAAAILIGLARVWHQHPDPGVLRDLASRLGSDVPFFLNGGTALVSGRGEVIRPLPPLETVWFVVVVPTIEISSKTATLYGALAPGDFSAGDRVRALAKRIRSEQGLDSNLLGNAFERAMVTLRPALAEVAPVMRSSGAPFVALSGAGPGHFTAVADLAEARSIAIRLADTFRRSARVVLCRPVGSAPILG